MISLSKRRSFARTVATCASFARHESATRKQGRKISASQRRVQRSSIGKISPIHCHPVPQRPRCIHNAELPHGSAQPPAESQDKLARIWRNPLPCPCQTEPNRSHRVCKPRAHPSPYRPEASPLSLCALPPIHARGLSRRARPRKRLSSPPRQPFCGLCGCGRQPLRGLSGGRRRRLTSEYSLLSAPCRQRGRTSRHPQQRKLHPITRRAARLWLRRHRRHHPRHLPRKLFLIHNLPPIQSRKRWPASLAAVSGW